MAVFVQYFPFPFFVFYFIGSASVFDFREAWVLFERCKQVVLALACHAFVGMVSNHRFQYASLGVRPSTWETWQQDPSIASLRSVVFCPPSCVLGSVPSVAIECLWAVVAKFA